MFKMLFELAVKVVTVTHRKHFTFLVAWRVGKTKTVWGGGGGGTGRGAESGGVGGRTRNFKSGMTG